MSEIQKLLSNLKIEKNSSIQKGTEAGTICPSIPRTMKFFLLTFLIIVSAESVASEIN